MPQESSKKQRADEFMAELARDPDFVRAQEAREKVRAAREAAFDLEEQPIVRDLKGSGIEVKSVWDLVNTKNSYGDAVPVLLAHLKRAYSPTTREGIARALTTVEARGIAGPVLGRVLEQSTGEAEFQLRWALVNALTFVGTKSDVPDLERLSTDPRFSDVRPWLLKAVRASRRRS